MMLVAEADIDIDALIDAAKTAGIDVEMLLKAAGAHGFRSHHEAPEDVPDIGDFPPHLTEAPLDLSKANRLGRLRQAIAERFLQCDEHAARGARMRDCGKLLVFNRYRVGDCEEPYRVLVNGSFCRERLCAVCMMRHSRWLHSQLTQAVSHYLTVNPKHQALLLTLTVKNMAAEKLRYWLDRLMNAFRKLFRYKRVLAAVSAWYRVVEITRNPETGELHPHIHVLLLCPPEYFKRKAGLYITQAEWVRMFRKALQVDYDPVCDIRAVPGVGGNAPLDELGRKSLFEVCKYVCDPGMFIEGDDLEDFPLLEIHEALHGRRLVGMSASLQRIVDELSLPDEAPDDFMPDNRLPEGAVYEGRETYQWQKGPTLAESRYVLVSFHPWQSAPPPEEAVMTSALPV
jgi:plasmid rolling circle replication initiator protein Rep